MAPIGILGTGALAAHVVAGLRRAGMDAPIIVSPRGAGVAARLAETHGVTVAPSNQAVLDRAAMVLICLPAGEGADILGGVSFQAHHSVCSAMAGVRPETLAPLVAPATLCQVMMPGASNAVGAGPCLLYPAVPDWQAVLVHLGPVVPVETQKEYDTAAVFGALSGVSFLLMQHLAGWFIARGVAPDLARRLVAATLAGNAAVLQRAEDWQGIIDTVATPSGVTEQLSKALIAVDAFGAWDDGLDAVLHRMTRG